MRRTALALSVVALLSSPVVARANGRFPQATQLAVDPARPAVMVVRTTFGLLFSSDAGATWGWVCEEQVGYGGAFDPAIALTASGVVVAGLADGLSRGAPGEECAFERSPLLDRQWIVDVATDRLDPTHVVAINAPIDVGLPGFQAFLAHSHDDGRTWSFAPGKLPEDLAPTTVDVAPSRPSRLYASGVGAFKAFGTVVRSDDSGATWSESSFDMRGAHAPYIAGVDVLDPERVWLRLDGDERDELLLSINGGLRFDAVLNAPELPGFALSPDGSKVAVGGPAAGVSIASTKDLVFTRSSTVHPRCLAWTTDGLWACGDDALDGFTLGLSTDGGRSFAPKLRLRDLVPLACVRESCAKAWAAVSAQIAPPVASDAGLDAAPGDVPASATGGGCQQSSGASPFPWALLGMVPWLRGTRSRRRRTSSDRASP